MVRLPHRPSRKNPQLKKTMWGNVIRRRILNKNGKRAISDVFAKVSFFIPLDFLVGVIIFRLSLEQFVGVSIVGGAISTALTPLFGIYIDFCRKLAGV